jgi:Ca2+/Na+ antiporter
VEVLKTNKKKHKKSFLRETVFCTLVNCLLYTTMSDNFLLWRILLFLVSYFLVVLRKKKEYRLIIYLRYYDDFTIEEIAKIVKKNKKYVYNVINRAKNELKVLLKEDVEDERY